MEQITLIPPQMLKIIPVFGGDKRQLNLFLRQCEYVISKFQGSEEQNVYLMNSITSRLTDRAASLISEREDVMTWTDFKEILIQHFGDPRSEECIAIELENLKIRNAESYLDFCNRIQSVRSVLISKVNQIKDVKIKESKITIYNNTSLNVFLYNLPEDMVRVVRLKSPETLESALSVVLEEVNFQTQYRLRSAAQPSVQKLNFS
ncbi:jg7289 [Pararge aegeria aegeria]|uniref:Jg7289 protein n=1 Tax=Pararge aegeria aegeria TaxID=348720 RepID=A0A8S4QAA1_9NEOP|nr:jg7289 [Pararge aegeria aegeria]